jgi:predicted flap endonuclease-1-like 5' DNA nuclease
VVQSSAEDDLKVIEGIGPKLEQVLKEAGIIDVCM